MVWQHPYTLCQIHLGWFLSQASAAQTKQNARGKSRRLCAPATTENVQQYQQHSPDNAGLSAFASQNNCRVRCRVGKMCEATSVPPGAKIICLKLRPTPPLGAKDAPYLWEQVHAEMCSVSPGENCSPLSPVHWDLPAPERFMLRDRLNHAVLCTKTI